MAWYNSSWSNRVKVTVLATKVDADLSNFPVYVDLSLLPAGFHSAVKADGGDIRVTTSDGTTEVPRQVVYYSGGAGELHFKGNVYDASDTDFYIYYGNSGASDYSASDTYGSQNVWSDYSAVFHLDNGTTLNPNDSTANNVDPTVTTGVTVTAGKITGGADFDGSHYFDFGSEAALNSWTVQSVSMWVYVNNGSTQYGRIVEKGANSEWTITINNSVGSGKVTIQRNSSPILTSASDLSDGYHHVVMLVDASYNTYLYVDGAADSNIGSSAPSNKTGNLYIGRYGGGSYSGTFKLDELRIRDGGSILTGTWISTEYNNQSSPATFFTIGSQESASNPQVSTNFNKRRRPRVFAPGLAR